MGEEGCDMLGDLTHRISIAFSSQTRETEVYRTAVGWAILDRGEVKLDASTRRE